MKLIILFLAMLIANPALAVTCLNDYDNSCVQEPGHSTAGDCTTLGYEKGGDKDCEHALYCPFDSSYARCVKLDSCANLGFTLDAIDKNCKKTLVCKEGGQTYRLCADYAKNLPTCADMGYVIPKNTNYPGCKSYKNCPLDSNFKRCETASSCTDLGFTDTIKSSWCGNIVNCDNLTLCADEKAPVCTDYRLNSCPTHGKCEQCSEDRSKYKLTSCTSNQYLVYGDECLPTKCAIYDTVYNYYFSWHAVSYLLKQDFLRDYKNDYNNGDIYSAVSGGYDIGGYSPDNLNNKIDGMYNKDLICSDQTRALIDQEKMGFSEASSPVDHCCRGNPKYALCNELICYGFCKKLNIPSPDIIANQYDCGVCDGITDPNIVLSCDPYNSNVGAPQRCLPSDTKYKLSQYKYLCENAIDKVHGYEYSKQLKSPAPQRKGGK